MQPRTRKATIALKSHLERAAVPAVVAAEPEGNAMPEGNQSRTISKEAILLLEEHAEEIMLSTIGKIETPDTILTAVASVLALLSILFLRNSCRQQTVHALPRQCHR